MSELRIAADSDAAANGRTQPNDEGPLETAEVVDILRSLGFEVLQYECRDAHFPISVWRRRLSDDGIEYASSSVGLLQQHVADLVLARLSSDTAEPSPILVDLVRRLFENRRSCCDSAETFASRSGICRRTLDRYVLNAGIRSTRLLFAAARTCHAFTDLKFHLKSKADLSHDVGVSSFRSLQRQCIAATGFCITDLVQNLNSHDFAVLLVAKLFVI